MGNEQVGGCKDDESGELRQQKLHAQSEEGFQLLLIEIPYGGTQLFVAGEGDGVR